MKGKCKITINFASDSDAHSALTALKQEEEFKKRSISKVNAEGKSLLITVDAEDVVALRATINSYLRSLQAIESINEEDIEE